MKNCRNFLLLCACECKKDNPMKKERIAIIGCGNLGKAIANGLMDKQLVAPQQLTVTRRNTAVLTELVEKGVVVTSDNAAAISSSDLIIVALKPYTILKVLEELRDQFDPNRHILVSLATGVSLNELQQALKNNTAVFRAMPNTAADVGESVTCIATNANNKGAAKAVNDCFNSIGETVTIAESLMDAATVIGACGIAYVLRFIRAMIQGGIEIGFDAETATAIVNQTVKGAAQLLIERKHHPEYEIDKVTTPKGCTIAGLNEMEHNGFSSALIKGITTSFEKID